MKNLRIFKVVPIPLPFTLIGRWSSMVIILWLMVFGVSASAADKLSPDTRQLLDDANKNRVERLRDRFKPIIQSLDAETASDFSKLYMDAVFNVFFAKDPNPQKAYQDWLKKNNGLVADRRLPAATQLAALYLQGHLYLVLEDEKNCRGLL